MADLISTITDNDQIGDFILKGGNKGKMSWDDGTCFQTTVNELISFHGNNCIIFPISQEEIDLIDSKHNISDMRNVIATIIESKERELEKIAA